MEVVGDLSLNVVGYDAQKSPLHLAHVIQMLMVEKIELDHPVSELKRTPNLQDFVKSCYQL
jgi:hypothetical protein